MTNLLPYAVSGPNREVIRHFLEDLIKTGEPTTTMVTDLLNLIQLEKYDETYYTAMILWDPSRTAGYITKGPDASSDLMAAIHGSRAPHCALAHAFREVISENMDEGETLLIEDLVQIKIFSSTEIQEKDVAK